MAEPTAPTSAMTPPEETVARARAVARDLGARLFISPSDLELYDELESFLLGAAPAMRAALAALDELTPEQLRARLAAIGAPVPAPANPLAPTRIPAMSAPSASASTETPSEGDGYVSPWPSPEAERGPWDAAAQTPDAEPGEDDAWLREWDREALLGGVEQ